MRSRGASSTTPAPPAPGWPTQCGTSGHPLIDGVRGRGLLLGVVLTDDVAAAVADAALDAGCIINAPRPGVLRLAPPLISVPGDLQDFVDALPALLDPHV